MTTIRSWFFPICIVLVTLALGTGLYIAGSPTQARKQKTDSIRAQDLWQISQGVEAFRNSSLGRLPNDLSELEQQVGKSPTYYYLSNTKDPITKSAYEYHVTNASENKYELCATFETQSVSSTQFSQGRYPIYPAADTYFSQHNLGRTCFQLQAQVQPKP